VTVKDIPQSILAWDLGRGESEVLAHAKGVEDCAAVLDDRAARHCARAVRVRVLGTGKILVLAKQRGLIPSVKAEIEHLTAAEFRLSDALIQKLLAEAGEGG
jgi:predicted nucleic acid-binding protein